MSAREKLNSYVRQLEQRLRLSAAIRGAAILASAALGATLVLVLIANGFAFSTGSVTAARIVLAGVLLGAAGAGLLAILRLNRRRTAAKAETAFPRFQQRLVTFTERDAAAPEPMIELLAADTLGIARSFDAEDLVPRRTLMAGLGAGVAALGILVWAVAAGPGFLGYGAALLWMGARAGVAPLYEIRIAPGNASVRRNSDELVTAQPIGFEAARVRLFARYDSSTKWNELEMKPQPGGSGFQFVFAGLPEGVEYYAAAGAVRSRHFRIGVVDLPAVKQIRVTYHYPAWTGLKTGANRPGGDLHAIEGTTADLAIRTDRPLRNGVLVLQDGRRLPLSGGAGNLYRASIAMAKDGAYHVAAIDRGQPVRLTEDYFIEADKADPPEVQIVRPGGDYRASPIEEVNVAVKASDEFGLRGLALHYSVNGGPEHTVDMMKQAGAKQAGGSAVISFENFKAVPGDVVSYYASAKDARTESRTDIYFLQAIPFEIDYSQSQQAGGGGGGGGMNGQSEISQREKEIIASTWTQRNAEKPPVQQAADTGKFLSRAQAELQKQAIALAGRMQLRELDQQNQEFSSFQNDMNAAAQAMGPAADQLHREQWNEALPNEQKALQHLLQAEATFRQIQVAFGNGGGGGGGNAGRDLAGLFDLELDTQKNQYETAQTAASSSQSNQNIDEALRKLDELARRQQDLADQQGSNGQSFQQRWQEEMLHREAEQLQKQLQDLAQSLQQGSGSSSSGQSAPGGSGQTSSSQAAGNSSVQRALDALRQAEDALSRAASPQQSAAAARRAADELQAAANALGAMQGQQASGQINSMARQADQLTNEQRAQAGRMRSLAGAGQGASGGSSNYEQKALSLAQDRQRLADGLAQLEQQMRNAEGELAPTQPAAASKLRDALGNLDQSDLETRLQRSADWLRQGYSPDPGSESQNTADLQQLSESLRQAQGALGPAQSPGSDSEAALDRAEQLRNEMQSLANALGARSGGSQAGSQGQQGQAGARNGAGWSSRGGALDRPRVGGGYGSVNGYNGARPWGGVYPNWNVDTGNNSNVRGQGARPDNSPIPGDPEAAFQQSVNTLNQLRRSVRQDPEIARQVQQLIRQMQLLDPRRFPGNPQVYGQMAGQALSSVDDIELQLRSKLGGQNPGQVRASAPITVPPGYQEAVAEYFRRLSSRSKNDR